MAAELSSLLLSFQPDSPEVEKRRDYDSKARSFVAQLSNVSAPHWLKGADTAQDVFAVGMLPRACSKCTNDYAM